MKKKLKILTIIAGILLLATLTLFVLWTSWENWSGAREWEKVRTTLIDNDVALDLASIVPPTPAEKDNFCAAPIIAPLLDYEWPVEEANLGDINEGDSVIYTNPDGRNRLLALKLPELESGSASPSFNTATHADLKSVRDALAKIDSSSPSILDWMKQFEAELTELDAAAKRPEATMPFPISEDFLANISLPIPAFKEFQDLANFQMIRACAALEAGDNAQAIVALEGMFKIHQATATHPTLIGYLVCQSTLGSCLSLIWHGMANDLWSTSDLLWIQTRLERTDIMPALERSLNFEMVAVQIGAAEYLKDISVRDSLELARIIEPMDSGKPAESSRLGLVSLVVPNGIWDHNKSFGCRIYYKHGIVPVRERRIPDTTVISAIVKNRSHRTFLASFTVPAISNLIKNAFHSAVVLELGELACAIERHRLETGDYCESLRELVPKYLPKIPTDLAAPSEPLRYGKRLHGDRYRIYSVGVNRTDDGGIPSFKENGKRAIDSGDWVWGYRFAKQSAEAE